MPIEEIDHIFNMCLHCMGMNTTLILLKMEEE